MTTELLLVKHIIHDDVEKPNTDELLEFVRRAFEHELKINWHLAIDAESDFLQQLPTRLRFAHQSKPPANQLQVEIDELLRKLFFTCEAVTLHPLEHGFSRAVVFRVEPRYRQRGQGESMVAKIGEWPLIEQEEHNFVKTVQGVVGGHRLPQRLELTRTRSLGGLVYSYAGLGEASGFAEFYGGTPPDQIIPVLENLFLETCFPWGRRKPVFKPAFNFAQHYFSHLHLSPAELRRALTSLFVQQDYLSRLNHSGSELRFLKDILLVNPIEFVIGHPLIGDAALTLVHGELTGYNIILDRHYETWLIDFAKTGRGLLLQDFASFETFIKFSLLESDTPRSFYEWEKELANSPTLQPPAGLLNPILSDPFLMKAHHIIMAIRQLAYKVSGEAYLREYLMDLLFYALKLTTIMALKPEQRALALVSAALICQRLLTSSST